MFSEASEADFRGLVRDAWEQKEPRTRTVDCLAPILQSVALSRKRQQQQRNRITPGLVERRVVYTSNSMTRQFAGWSGLCSPSGSRNEKGEKETEKGRGKKKKRKNVGSTL